MIGLKKNHMGRGQTHKHTNRQTLQLMDQLDPEGRVGENILLLFGQSFFLNVFGQSGEACQLRVCYQRGLPRLVFKLSSIKQQAKIIFQFNIVFIVQC